MENLQGGTLALEHRYHIAERTVSFGLTTIYAGTQDPFDLPVRITVYDGLMEAGADLSMVERIKNSARQSSDFDAKGLLSTADFGEIDRGIPFVIEETTAGRSLAQLLEKKGVLSPEEVADLVDQLARMLSEAHDKQIYHGDLRPHWIMLPEDDDLKRARLSHFGLGFTMAELLAMSQAVLTTDLVETFPPEAFDAAARDPESEDAPSPSRPPSFPSAAADQWSLAALSYRLLVGVHPFFDDPVDASEGILGIKTDEAPSLTEMGVADKIADTIDRGLQRQPDRRFADVSAFASALRQAVDGPQASSTGSRDHAELNPASPSPTTRQEEEDAPNPEFSGPQPSGYLLTISLILLLLSNLGWFFFTMTDDEVVAEQEESATSTNTLPSGLQLQTSPPGATLFVLDTDESLQEDTPSLGSTPFLIPPTLHEQTSSDLLVRLPGFLDQRLTIEDTPAGQDIRLVLHPANPAEDEGI